MQTDRALERMNRDYEKWARALFWEKTETDYYAGIANARDEGWFEGMEQGRIAGMQEGRIAGIQEGRIAGMQEGRIAGMQEGRLEGVQEGRIAGMQEAAKRMKVRGRPPAEIAEDTGLSLEEIARL
jgi:predicted transposase YdaD